MSKIIDEFLLMDSSPEEDKQNEFMFIAWLICCDERLAMLSGAMDGECLEILNPDYINGMNLYYQDYLQMAQMDKENQDFLVFFNE